MEKTKRQIEGFKSTHMPSSTKFARRKSFETIRDKTAKRLTVKIKKKGKY